VRLATTADGCEKDEAWCATLCGWFSRSIGWRVLSLPQLAATGAAIDEMATTPLLLALQA
jgi:hypothetical protein